MAEDDQMASLFCHEMHNKIEGRKKQETGIVSSLDVGKQLSRTFCCRKRNYDKK